MDKTLLGILGLSFLVIVALGFHEQVFSDASRRTDEPLTNGFSLEGHNEWIGSAMNFTRTLTFNGGERGVYIGQSRKDPIYPLILAPFFLLFGNYVWVIYLVNFLLFFTAIILLWFISKEYLSTPWYILPVFLFAVFPGAISQVWVPNVETTALVTVMLFFFSFLRYQHYQSIVWLVFTTVSLSLFIFVKPVMLYFLPVFIIFLFITGFGKRFARLVFVMGIFVLIIGSWMARNYFVFGSWQIGDGGHSLLRKASLVNFSRSELLSAGLSFTVGDVIASKLYDKFPKDAPLYWDPSIEERWYLKYLTDKEIAHHVYLLEGKRVTRIELDRKLYDDAFVLIRMHPVKFIATSVLGFLRLNAPVTYNGQEFMRFLADRNSIPLVSRIVIILFIRILWHAFVVLALYGIVVNLRHWQLWGMPILVVLYLNGVYSVFTHAEARYLLPVMPIYAIAAADTLRILSKKYLS